MVLEDRDTGHSQVDVLSRPPLDLRRDGHLDGIFREDCHGLFFADQPGESLGICPVEEE